MTPTNFRIGTCNILICLRKLAVSLDAHFISLIILVDTTQLVLRVHANLSVLQKLKGYGQNKYHISHRPSQLMHYTRLSAGPTSSHNVSCKQVFRTCRHKSANVIRWIKRNGKLEYLTISNVHSHCSCIRIYKYRLCQAQQHKLYWYYVGF